MAGGDLMTREFPWRQRRAGTSVAAAVAGIVIVLMFFARTGWIAGMAVKRRV